MASDYWAKRRNEELEQENKKPAPTIPVDYNSENTREEILHKIKSLKNARSLIIESANEKATAISNYARKVAITEIKLKNGLIDKFDGIEIGHITASSARKISEGICWKELNEKELKEGLYKANIITIEAIKAELNGLQSINKHLE